MGLETAGALQRRRLEATPRPPTPTSGERREKDRELSGSSPASASSAAAAAQAGAFGRSPSASPARSRSPAVSWRSVFSARPNSDETVDRSVHLQKAESYARASGDATLLARVAAERDAPDRTGAPTVIKRLLVLLLAAAACRHLPPPDAPPRGPSRRRPSSWRGPAPSPARRAGRSSRATAAGARSRFPRPKGRRPRVDDQRRPLSGRRDQDAGGLPGPLARTGDSTLA